MQLLTFMGRNARWLAGGFLLMFFSSFGQTFYIALSNGDIRREYDLSHGDFGLLYMVATLLSASTLPALGWLLDRYRAWMVAAATTVCLAAATTVMATAASLPLLFLALYFLRLFGQGMMTETAMTATGRWFAANRGRAMAVNAMGLHVGTGLFPLIFVVASATLGWRGTWFACAVALLVVALPIVVWTTIRERDRQSEAGPKPKTAVRDWTMGEVVRSPTFYLVSAAVLAPPFIGTTLLFHQVYLTELRDWPMEVFASGFVLMAVTTGIFAFVCGALIDRFSAVRLLPFFLVPLAIACFVVAQFTAIESIFVFMVCLGISQGFSSTLLGALWPELYGTRYLGSVRSITVAMMVLASAVGPGITGQLIDWDVSYPLQIGVMGLYCIGVSVAMVFIARRLLSPELEEFDSAEAAAPAAGGRRTMDRLDPQPREG
ncbi:MFS transporter [Jiella marina]|uniref:MFS transporter n=1 Tax=Jiella sp. LLJ827 TaxID=2917712 RepID=UPI002100DBC1|nr:MFS transporter [Jiella sp. LLJ827]MCQ0988499.1 MFS transporter [Jiella sp. LLJ827]